MAKGKWLIKSLNTKQEVEYAVKVMLEKKHLTMPSGDDVVYNAYRLKPAIDPIKKEGNKIYFSKEQTMEIIERVLKKAEKESIKSSNEKTKKTAPKQITIEEVAEELDTDAAFLELLYHLCGKDALEWYFRKRLKEIYGSHSL